MSESSQLQQLMAAQLGQEQRRGVLILDTRPTEQFASFHISNALQIGLIGLFASWAAILIGPSQRILLVVENANRALEAFSRLARVGLENVVGYTIANKQQWQRDGLEINSIPIYRSEDVCRDLRSDSSPHFIDVRSRAEWLEGHLPDAISMPLLELSEHPVSLGRSKPILVYSEEDYRATIAASMLLRNHVGGIGILNGGVQERQACGMALEIPKMRVPA